LKIKKKILIGEGRMKGTGLVRARRLAQIKEMRRRRNRSNVKGARMNNRRLIRTKRVSSKTGTE